MTIQEKKALFERNKSLPIHGSRRLTFTGADGYDVYNCSAPFVWEGKTYIFGRVEKRELWAQSHVRLFEQSGEDIYTAVDNVIYPLEDPFYCVIGGESVLGGTHVRKRGGKIDTYYTYFYRGTDIRALTYFTTGPDYMKDIRLVGLKNGRIGVFSRPKNDAIREQFGAAGIIGFTTVRSLEELTDEVVNNATPLAGLFGPGEWGGCNQALLLNNGHIGVIGHQSYTELSGDTRLNVYVNIAFEMDPDTLACSDVKVIGTRSCYPAGPSKKPELADCVFTSGIVMRADGKADLYSGMSDVAEGRAVIGYPFSSPIAE